MSTEIVMFFGKSGDQRERTPATVRQHQLAGGPAAWQLPGREHIMAVLVPRKWLMADRPVLSRDALVDWRR